VAPHAVLRAPLTLPGACRSTRHAARVHLPRLSAAGKPTSGFRSRVSGANHGGRFVHPNDDGHFIGAHDSRRLTSCLPADYLSGR
jgi:hypothetical protein